MFKNVTSTMQELFTDILRFVLQCKVLNTVGAQKRVVCYHLSTEDNVKDEQLFGIEPKIPAGVAFLN